MRFAPLLLLACATVLHAQDAMPADMVVTAKGPAEMTSTDTDTVVTLRDTVKVTGTDLLLTCDFLKVITSRAEDAAAAAGELKNAKQLTATGHVRIERPDLVATCGHAEMFPRDSRIVLTEQPVVTFINPHSVVSGVRITLFKNELGHWSSTVEQPTMTGPGIKALDTAQKGPGLAPPAGAPAAEPAIRK